MKHKVLDQLAEMCDELNQSNSNLDKKKVLDKYLQPGLLFGATKDLATLVEYVHNPFKQFNVTSENCKKHPEIMLTDGPTNLDIFSLLDMLNERTVTGNKAIGLVNAFVLEHPEHIELIYNILDRNLKTRTGVALINEVYPGLIPVFDVALADEWKSGMKIDKKPINYTEYVVLRKLDGCRCIAVVKDGDVKFYSRSGKEFNTLGKLKEAILKKHPKRDFVLDGEICIEGDDGKENFQDVMKEIGKKDHTIQRPCYIAFDYLSIDEFHGKAKSVDYIFRLIALRHAVNGIDFIRPISHAGISNEDQLQQILLKAIEKGWEGLILRRNAPYKSGRSKDLLKVKKFHDAEYVVEDVELGLMRIVGMNEKGLTEERQEEVVTNIFITHKGNRVSVGSGMSVEQRREFKADPSKIVGMTITVKYFEETKNQNGQYSLRFPTLKCIHGLKRTT
ncbi:MAG TPA: RNA ligase family protein [Saccharofermentans sp.]|nr:RNA ligase family protein [Saccharofermentans sp.]